MSFHAALPPWLQKAVEQAGDATVILKPGDRPFVIRSKSPYHLGTQPLTNLIVEGLAQQILSEDGQQALYNGTPVEETLNGTGVPVDVHALRLDNEVVIKLRRARNGDAGRATEDAASPVDEIALALEEETRSIKARAAAAPPDAPAPAPAPETPSPVADMAHVRRRAPFVVQNAGGEVIVQNAGGEVIAEIELPVDEQEVESFIAGLSPAPTAAAPQQAGSSAAVPLSQAAKTIEWQAAGNQTPPLATQDPSEASRSELEERAQEEAARQAQEAAARREQEEAARLAQETAARREQEEAARLAQEAAARREQEEAARLAQEAAARREQEEAARLAQEAAARREQEEAARLAQEAAARREQEEAARLAQEAAARREQEEAVRLAQEAAARREQEEAVRLAQEAAARREQEEAARLVQEAAARREREEAAQHAALEAANREAEQAERARVEQDDEREFARATVVELNAKRRLAVATTELTDWILEAMDQGATALYLRAGKVPSARIDGQVEALASEPLPMSMFERAGALMMSGEEGWRPAGEWAWSKDIPGSGSVHCQAFSDGQGGGFIVQLPVSLAGLDKQVPPHIRAACETGEGLVVIAAPFAEDMVAMVGAVVSWNAHRRPGFVVAFGAGGGLQAVAGNAFISERALPATDYEMGVAVQNALRERPDVVVVAANDILPGADALVAAAVGRLVIVGVVARTAPRAVEVVLKNVGPNRRALAAAFRGGCSWRGFRRSGGSRLVIADSLVSNEHVAALIEGADIAGLHSTQSNREDGMRALDSALAAAVTRRRITLREAAACAVDRRALIALVRRQAREARAAARAEQRASHRAPVISMTGA